MSIYIALGLALLVIAVHDWHLSVRQRALEEEIYRLRRQLGMMREAGSEPSEQVKELAAGPGNYVEALRVYRQETGSNLKQAKAVVDRLRAGASDA